MICIEVEDSDWIKEGEKGIAICSIGTFDCNNMITVEANDASTVKAADDNGWDIDFEDSECIAADKWTWTAYSKDINSGEGRKDWFGLSVKDEVKVKCFVSDELDEEPDFTDEVDVS